MVALVKMIRVINRLVRPRHDDDFVDRLHYVAAPAVLSFMATLHGLKQYFGRPVECWPPAEMRREQWMNYVHGLCFVSDNYFVAFDEYFPMRRIDRQSHQIHYYQWVPFLLMAQALLFILPKAFCHLFNSKNDFNIAFLLERYYALEGRDPNDGKQRFAKVEEAPRAMAGALSNARRDRAVKRRGLDLNRSARGEAERRRRWDNYGEFWQILYKTHSEKAWLFSDQRFTLGYIGFKYANFLLVLLQLHLLNTYFGKGGEKYTFWGLSVLDDLVNGRDWAVSGLFPRVTFCDVQIRQPQRSMAPQTFTFQCLLSMNMLNELIFVSLWFALFVLALIDSLNLAITFYHCFCWSSADKFIWDHLQNFLCIDPKSELNSKKVTKEEVRVFVRDSLGRDTLTFLRIIDSNCQPLITARLIGNLWEDHIGGNIGFLRRNH